MRYGIVANPKAGNLSPGKRLIVLDEVKRVLGWDDCIVAGLDTESPEDFRKCSADLAAKVETLVIAGGDGTFNEVVNSVDPAAVLAFLPFGSGNGLSYSLKQSHSILKAAKQIRDGEIHSLDLILCDDGHKAVTATIGLESSVLIEREKYSRQGLSGRVAYSLAIIKSLRTYDLFDATVNSDGSDSFVEKAWSIIVTKVPFYGYGLKEVPNARLSDGKLHMLSVDSNLWGLTYGFITSFLGGNKTGTYWTADSVSIYPSRDMRLQTDGNLRQNGREFHFRVLPGELKMRYSDIAHRTTQP